MTTSVKQIVLFVVAILLFTGHAVTAQTKQAPAAKTQTKVVYSCPMHPDVTSTKRGKCRKCGMDLRRTKTEIADVPPETQPVDPVADPSTPKPKTTLSARRKSHIREFSIRMASSSISTTI
jgi:hypothetical protein